MIDKIKSILGSPFYYNKNVIIYNMDCLDGINILKKNKVEIDSTITSPPYNIGKEYEKNMDVNDYIEWLEKIFSLVHSITCNNGSLILNVGYLKINNIARAIPIPYLLWDKIPFYMNQEIVWNYGAGVACKKYLSPRNEKLLWYVKDENDYTFNLDPIRDPNVKYPNQKKNGKLRTNPLGKNPSDVWQIPKVTSGKNRSSKERMPHPAQFPEQLISNCIQGFTNKDDLILDPFIGSGTTAKVAMKHDRQCIGFEINEEYCETIKKRLEIEDARMKAESSQVKIF